LLAKINGNDDYSNCGSLLTGNLAKLPLIANLLLSTPNFIIFALYQIIDPLPCKN